MASARGWQPPVDVPITYTGERAVWVWVAGPPGCTTTWHRCASTGTRTSRWAAGGVETRGLRLVEVTATRIRYWTFEDGGEVEL